MTPPGKHPCYPYSPRAQMIVALHNRTTLDKLPDAFRWAANPYMAAWMDLLGAELEAGRQVQDDDGRWWSVRRVMARASA